jgi:hypothetical protein
LFDLSQAKELMADYVPGLLENSAKMLLLFHLIEESVRKGDKMLVFRYRPPSTHPVSEYLKATISIYDALGSKQGRN